jgi:raffinose/stachyose/melibiose transport system permease protein
MEKGKVKKINTIAGGSRAKSGREGSLIGKIIGEIALVISTIVVWVPIYYFIIGAFKERTDIVKFPLLMTFETMSFDNIVETIDKMNFFNALRNTSTITLGGLLLVVAFGSIAGFAIARINKRGFKIYYGALIALMVVPFIGVLISLIRLTVSLNLYSTIWAGILIQAAWNLPFAVFLYAGFIRALPKELEEAAYVDGCSMFRVYFNIFLPLLAPVTATACIRTGIGIWNDYLLSLTVLNDTYTPTLMVAVNRFFGNRVSEYGLAFAGILLASVPIMIVFIFLQKYFIKGLAAGAVKG